MSDAEVALELTKLVLQKEEPAYATAEKPREFVLALYAECAKAVRMKGA